MLANAATHLLLGIIEPDAYLCPTKAAYHGAALEYTTYISSIRTCPSILSGTRFAP